MRLIKISTNTTHIYSKPMCACIGYFDGIHLGHCALIKKTVEVAKEKGCEPAMITFEPDPWVTIKGEHNVHHISTMRERINRAVELGIENIIILDFTKELSEYSPKAFMDLILAQIKLKAIICGYDFHYGYKGEGNPDTLKETIGVDVYVVPAVEDDEGKISSTRIEQCVKEGRMEDANQMLGYPYSITGKVVVGNHRGRTIGYPTANLLYSEEYILPKVGVYAGYVYIHHHRYRAMINLGHNPTFNYSNLLSLEVHVMNFNEDIYNSYVTVEFMHYLRDEKRFSNALNLTMQLDQDTRSINQILDSYE